MVESAPATHKFKLSVFQPNDPKNFIKFVRKEVKLLRTSLPPGIHVKGFEDRMVRSQFLFSVLFTVHTGTDAKYKTSFDKKISWKSDYLINCTSKRF